MTQISTRPLWQLQLPQLPNRLERSRQPTNLSSQSCISSSSSISHSAHSISRVLIPDHHYSPTSFSYGSPSLGLSSIQANPLTDASHVKLQPRRRLTYKLKHTTETLLQKLRANDHLIPLAPRGDGLRAIWCFRELADGRRIFWPKDDFVPTLEQVNPYSKEVSVSPCSELNAWQTSARRKSVDLENPETQEIRANSYNRKVIGSAAYASGLRTGAGVLYVPLVSLVSGSYPRTTIGRPLLI